MISDDVVSPPFFYLLQIAEHCPRALTCYLMLWRDMDRDFMIHVHKDDVRRKYLMSPTKFMNDLLLIRKEGLVSIDETPNMYHLELTGWDEEEGLKLC